jgi:phenylacetate-CoA ligase
MLDIIGRLRAVVGESPYWNPKTETLDRERLEELQLAKLRIQCAWAAER